MYKRETRYKGQKRVPVGRSSRSSDVLDIKIKGCVSLKDTPDGDLFEESMSLSAIKEEPTFGNCSDPTVPTVQLNEDIFEQDQDLDNMVSRLRDRLSNRNEKTLKPCSSGVIEQFGTWCRRSFYQVELSFRKVRGWYQQEDGFEGAQGSIQTVLMRPLHPGIH